MKRIYLDNAAITPIDKKVVKEMQKYMGAEYANPSSIHTEGAAAKQAVLEARKRIADILQGHSDEIIFTASGTEANNIAIEGLMHWLLEQGKDFPDLHMITTTIEHPSVLECVAWLEKWGLVVDRISVDEQGMVNLKELKEKIRPNTYLISVMTVNNEIGTIQPIREIAKIVRHARKSNTVMKGVKDGEDFLFPYFHTDASQAPMYLPLDTRSLGADLITLDGHKVYGPRGIGMLWARRGVELGPIIRGGKQERGVRSGTENLPAIAGLAKALEIADAERGREVDRLTKLRDYCIESLMKKFSNRGVLLNGHPIERVANNINISLPGIDTEFFVLQLDAAGIAVSTKSSCLRDESESYVVRAIGRDSDEAGSSVRFSLGKNTTKKDIDYLLKTIEKILSRAS